MPSFPQDLAVYDCRFVLDYYRLTADQRLLFGGGCNYSGRDSRDIAADLLHRHPLLGQRAGVAIHGHGRKGPARGALQGIALAVQVG